MSDILWQNSLAADRLTLKPFFFVLTGSSSPTAHCGRIMALFSITKVFFILPKVGIIFRWCALKSVSTWNRLFDAPESYSVTSDSFSNLSYLSPTVSPRQ